MELPAAFPAGVEHEAQAASKRSADLDDPLPEEFITIDPAGSKDLDQAVHIEEVPSGFRVLYAIADVGRFVEPGGAIDVEATRRGQTLYAPDERVPLYPAELSEGAASLLPGVVRPAVLFEHQLDGAARRIATTVRRAVVKSTEQLTYEQAQAEIDSAEARPTLRLLKSVGGLLEKQEVERGGVSLNAPEQEIHHNDEGYELVLRTPLPVEGWNSQISLLTGMAAADIQIEAGAGLLRTMPEFEDEGIKTLRLAAKGLDVGWPEGEGYAEFIRSLDPSHPKEAALLNSAARLFRGTGYTLVDPGALARHAAIAAPYSHVTAPLRRLADRFVNEILIAHCAGASPPKWALDGLKAMPEAMRSSHKKARELERRTVDLMEAALLEGRVGETFRAIVVESGAKSGTVQLCDPPIVANCATPALPLGEVIDVTLDVADLQAAQVVFSATS